MLGGLVELKGAFKMITGAGVGALLAFLIIVTALPDRTDVRVVLGIYASLMAVFGFVFLTRGWEFTTPPLSYLCGAGTVAIVAILSGRVDIGMGSLFLLITASLLLILYPRPRGIADVLLSGPLYFSGAMTVLAAGSALGLFKSLQVPMAIVFIGFLGTIGTATGSAARLIFSKPKP